MRSTFAFPTAIRFGVGVRDELAPTLQEHGSKRPLLVMDSGLAALPPFQALVKALEDAGLAPAVFRDFAGTPTDAHVAAGVAAWRSHDADALVAIGGGVGLDLGKVIALLATNDGTVFDYEDRPGAKSAENDLPPLIAIPTTAGTGSEVGRSSVISDSDDVKHVIFSPKLLPVKVLADPELTLGLPAKVTAATGMDALTHCVEAYLARGFHPLCDGIAIHGVRQIFASLRLAVEDGSNLEARSGMLMAAMMGAVAFQKGLGAAHSLAHALGSVKQVHHGLANALVLPAVLRFNKATSVDRLATLGRTIGIVGDDDEAADQFIHAVEALRRQIGIPAKLAEVGVEESDIPALVAVAVKDGCHPFNPRACTGADFEAMLRAML